VITPMGEACGSGFIVDAKGTVVTNYHVIEDAKSATATLAGGIKIPVEGQVGVFPDKDLALVRLRGGGASLKTARLAEGLPRKGEQVLAFGSPQGLSFTTSDGIVSAIRTIAEVKALGLPITAQLIQTTAPISGGNSGGPLVNLRGEVVGINTYGSVSDRAQNLNFSIAVQELRSVLQQARDQVQPLASSAPLLTSRGPQIPGQPGGPRQPLGRGTGTVEDLTTSPTAQAAAAKGIKQVHVMVVIQGRDPTADKSAQQSLTRALEQAVRDGGYSVASEVSSDDQALLIMVVSFANDPRLGMTSFESSVAVIKRSDSSSAPKAQLILTNERKGEFNSRFASRASYLEDRLHRPLRQQVQSMLLKINKLSQEP